MTLLERIPLPGTPGEEFSKGLETGKGLLESMMQNRLRGAQAEREMARARLPFGGVMPPGPAGQVAGLEMVKQLYGENSPQFQKAKELFDLNRQSTESRVNYQNILAGTAPKRFATPLGKTAHEIEDVEKGNLPGTDLPMTPEQQEYYRGQYGLDVLKKTTDTKTRERNLFARNIDVTLSQIDPKILTQYSGLKGKAQLLNDQRESLMGRTPERYQKFEDNITAADLLSEQVRQFYGTSITPSMKRELKYLTNPTSWLFNSDVALSKFNKFVKLLKSEEKTYQRGLKSPDIYSGNVPIEDNTQQQPPQSSASQENNIFSVEGQIQQVKKIGNKEYVMINNQWYERG